MGRRVRRTLLAFFATFCVGSASAQVHAGVAHGFFHDKACSVGEIDSVGLTNRSLSLTVSDGQRNTAEGAK